MLILNPYYIKFHGLFQKAIYFANLCPPVASAVNTPQAALEPGQELVQLRSQLALLRSGVHLVICTASKMKDCWPF